jgi:hypothetical protein
MFLYKMECPSCSKSFVESRENPYVKQRRVKVCEECRVSRSSKVVDQGGFPGIGCGACMHFLELRNGWGQCALGHYNPNEEDYAVGGEVYRLVYIEDICNDREVHEESNEQA